MYIDSTDFAPVSGIQTVAKLLRKNLEPLLLVRGSHFKIMLYVCTYIVPQPFIEILLQCNIHYTYVVRMYVCLCCSSEIQRGHGSLGTPPLLPANLPRG